MYLIPCAGANLHPCPGRYVGETERTAAARFKEHTSTATNALGKYKSAMLQHAREHNHHFREEDMTVLASENDWVKRGIKEAIFIKSLNPSINIDPGRHSLSSHFDQILAKEIVEPPSPRPHDQNIESIINTAPRRQGRPKKAPTSSSSSSQPPQSSTQITAPMPLSQPSLPQRQSQRLLQRQQQQANAF